MSAEWLGLLSQLKKIADCVTLERLVHSTAPLWCFEEVHLNLKR